MKFKLFGTEIYLSFLFLAFLTIMLATDKTGFILPTFFAVFVHEFGHLFIMWVLDCTPKKIKLIPASVQIVNSFSRGYKNDVIIALSGPVLNLVMFVTLYYNYLCFKNEFTLYFALLNLLIGVFNLLPVKGLDGGTVLFSLLCKNIDINKAALILKFITLIIALVVIGAAVLLSINGKLNTSLYIMGIYLLVICLIKT